MTAPRCGAIVSLGAAALTLLAPSAAAGARRRADLTMRAVTVAGPSVTQGERLTVAEVVANAGAARARPSIVGHWLSRDRRRSRDDVRLSGGRKGRALRPRARARARARLLVPASVAPGAYHVIACADARRRVR